VPELLGAPEYNKEGWPRVIKATATRETPAKATLRHRAKHDGAAKRRRLAVHEAGDSTTNGNGRQSQSQRGAACSFPGWCAR